MQRWEIKKHWVPVDVKTDTTSQGDYTALTFLPKWEKDFNRAWAEAEVLANEGWELISLAPLNKGYVCSWVPQPNENTFVDPARLGQSFGYGCSFTAGYMLVFKRQRP